MRPYFEIKLISKHNNVVRSLQSCEVVSVNVSYHGAVEPRVPRNIELTKYQ
jgi:hypothetical protein